MKQTTTYQCGGGSRGARVAGPGFSPNQRIRYNPTVV